ncbi:MAG: HAD family hydrolase [Thermocrispum sp.]
MTEVGLPDAVLWDMDGTLVDSEKLWEIGLHELAEHLGGRLSPEARLAMVGTNVTVTMELLFADLGLELTPAAFAEADRWLEARMHELFTDEVPWQPGAREALRMVRDTGLPTALVTSTVRSLTEGALDYIGREWFDVTVAGDEVGGENKPHPEPYLIAAGLLAVDPGRCVAIEDSPVGTASAVAAGCSVIVVPGDVDVDPGPRLVKRESLTGLEPADLAAALVPAG